ncbi:MAG: amino acid racemase [Caldimonas sp.]
MIHSASDADLTLGVIGGMGPLATADFLAKLVQATPVTIEQEHLRVLVDSNPKVPDRNRAIAGTGVSPGPLLAGMAAGLERAGANFLVMACNTAHVFESDIRVAISIPFVSIIDEASDECVRGHAGIRRVGLLATPACTASGLYQRALGRNGLSAVVLNRRDEEVFLGLLHAIKRDGVSRDLRIAMKRLAEALVADGAEMVIAGCTEVPLVLDAADLAVPLLDATSNLARRCVQYARRQSPFPAVARLG